MAIQATEESVEKRQKELEKKFQEEMRLMKEMMQQEISEQRLLRNHMHRKKKGNQGDIPQPSMAGDLEDDDEDDDDGLLHDRESWGI